MTFVARETPCLKQDLRLDLDLHVKSCSDDVSNEDSCFLFCFPMVESVDHSRFFSTPRSVKWVPMTCVALYLRSGFSHKGTTLATSLLFRVILASDMMNWESPGLRQMIHASFLIGCKASDTLLHSTVMILLPFH